MAKKLWFGMLVTVLAFGLIVGCANPDDSWDSELAGQTIGKYIFDDKGNFSNTDGYFGKYSVNAPVFNTVSFAIMEFTVDLTGSNVTILGVPTAVSFSGTLPFSVVAGADNAAKAKAIATAAFNKWEAFYKLMYVTIGGLNWDNDIVGPLYGDEKNAAINAMTGAAAKAAVPGNSATLPDPTQPVSAEPATQAHLVVANLDATKASARYRNNDGTLRTSLLFVKADGTY